MNELFENNWLSAILLQIIRIYSVVIARLAMEIHFQTTDHVVAVEKVAEQHIATK